jgi:ribosome-binding protein aMBF1 (putative translation factor)
MAPKRPSTSDALKILQRRYYDKKPERMASLAAERLNARIAREIYDLRAAAGLSQRQLAERLGTTASVICRLEDADYDGHSLSMLQRVAAALDAKIEIRFSVTSGRRRTTPKAKRLTAVRARARGKRSIR